MCNRETAYIIHEFKKKAIDVKWSLLCSICLSCIRIWNVNSIKKAMYNKAGVHTQLEINIHITVSKSMNKNAINIQCT
jgi:hypothetical protein